MSCYGCSRKYGLFCKEYGCPNCGYSYCAKCLKRPINVPRHDNKVLNVCLICYDKLSKMQANADADKVIDCDALPGDLVTKLRLPLKNTKSPDAVAEKTDALFDNVLPSEELAAVLSPTFGAEAGSAQDTTGTEDIDENLDSAISKRLQNLKAVDVTSDDELRARLSNLSGMPHQKNYDKKELLLSTDQRTDQDKIKDLLQQFLGETQLDQRVNDDRNDAISDIEKRLRALRDAPIDNPTGSGAVAAGLGTTNTPSDNEEENDEAVLQNIMQKYVAEARLQPTGDPLENELGTTNNPSSSINEELPWCNICDEDAVFRCHGCDGDLYCAQCYRECHDDEEYRAHAKEKYSAPPNFKENHF
ncbi:abscission/NoCut checkpoint regulator [Drosophila grimshawi]|uniref:GH12533 n=1 Tax=Drosophila grimshawi TaxID=7222 RepID=B4JJR9_DROGR|nr:abscission/NoCut checkpoint regulator [Drosophila grimshawi]EDV99821.1 GH12533 [Drosophila grimshawi]